MLWFIGKKISRASKYMIHETDGIVKEYIAVCAQVSSKTAIDKRNIMY